ncbi:MAG: peptide deformylase [Deltaproteobacteria bacterium]|nr:peptide deformylase [Deltaproteobacteria bacterium]
MALRPILNYPDPILRERSREVTEFGDALKQLVADMGDTMADAEGAGLAAVQVGEPIRLFIVEGRVVKNRNKTREELNAEEDDDDAPDPDRDLPPVVFANPELIELSDESQSGDEGCLSFPGIFVPVKRSMRAKVRAQDVDGKPFELEGSALFARALQHETDHLNARLLVDVVGPVKREIIKRKMKKAANPRDDDDSEE